MKRTDKDGFNDVQTALLYVISKPMPLKEYCETLDYSIADTINFKEWVKKEGFAYDYATKANWGYRYEKFKKEKIEMFRKRKEEKKDSFLAKAQKFLKKCYDRGATIEYEEAEGKWVDLPKGLPIDFSKFDEGKIRLKFDPTYEQVEQFKKELDKNYVAVETEEQSTRNKMIDSIMKEMKDLTDQATIRTFMDIMNYVRWEFHSIDEKIEDLYARTEE